MIRYEPSDRQEFECWHIADKERAKHFLGCNKKLSQKEKAAILDYFGKDNVAMVDISGNGRHLYWRGTMK